MNITKIGHCCLLIEIDGARILTDPGSFTTAQNDITGIDAIVITHEHGDHFHVGSVTEIMSKNPGAIVITNSAVGRLLDAQGIAHTVIEGNGVTDVKGVSIEAFDCRHEEIYEEFGQVQNTGYFIAGKIYHPGDSFVRPGKKVEVLALPVAGPWCKIPDAIRFAIDVGPAKAFPVHEGMLQKDKTAGIMKTLTSILSQKGIEFVPMGEGDMREF